MDRRLPARGGDRATPDRRVKVEAHREFVRRLAVERGLVSGHVWWVREECIGALEGQLRIEQRAKGLRVTNLIMAFSIHNRS